MLKRIVLLGVLGLLLVIGATLGSMYWAVTTAQPYYLQALEQPTDQLEEGSRQLENRLTTFTSDVQSRGEWQTVVTAQEMNGWLAVKLPESYPEVLPDHVRNPRVSITPDDFILAAQFEKSGLQVVISLYVEPFVTEEGDLAVEVKKVSAGSMPWPTKEVVDEIAKFTKPLPIGWTQSNGNNVMIIDHSIWDTDLTQQRVLEAVELADGEMFLSGYTEKRSNQAQAVTETAGKQPDVDEPDFNEPIEQAPAGR